MRTVELLIDEEQDDFGVEAISLVKFPAIEENFVYFNKDQKLTMAKVDEDQKLLIGPALIPEKMIPGGMTSSRRSSRCTSRRRRCTRPPSFS